MTHPHVAAGTALRVASRRVTAVERHARPGWLDDLEQDLSGEARWVGAGDPLDVDALAAARRQIEAMIDEPRLSRSAADRVEGTAAVVLYSAIGECRADATVLDDPGFWSWVVLTQLWNFAAWREPKAFSPKISEDGSPASKTTLKPYVDGLRFHECVASRMYLRVKCLGGLDHGNLASAVSDGTDFWRSHILRVRAGEHPALVRAMVRRQADDKTRLTRDPLRDFAKEFNRTLTNLVPALLDEDAADELVGELWQRQIQRRSR